MRTVFITGASRGIGKATAKKLLAEDRKVIGTSTSVFDIMQYKQSLFFLRVIIIRKDAVD